jgi:hypothetical protein
MTDPVAASPDHFGRKPEAGGFPNGVLRRDGDRVILFVRHGLYYAICPECLEYEYRQAWQKIGRWVHVRSGFARCGS